jgi:hypothetical protein
MLRFVVLAASALASAADWDAGTNATCPRLWSACGGDATAWTGRLDASELLVMVVQQTLKSLLARGGAVGAVRRLLPLSSGRSCSIVAAPPSWRAAIDYTK